MCIRDRLHEAIGHAFEADFNRKRTSIFCDLFGKKVCNEHINVVDDGTMAFNRGAVNFDECLLAKGETEAYKLLKDKDFHTTNLIHEKYTFHLKKHNFVIHIQQLPHMRIFFPHSISFYHFHTNKALCLSLIHI